MPNRKFNPEKNSAIFKIITALIFAFFFVAGIISEVNAQTIYDLLLPIPIGLSATVVPPSQITITWSAASNARVTGYYIYKNNVMVTDINSTSYSEGGLSPAGYTYSVASHDATGRVSYQSTPITAFITLDKTAPSVPTGVSTTPVSTSAKTSAQVKISWIASTDSIGVKGYYLYKNNKLITATTTPITLTSYTDTLSPGVYNYTVAAYDASGNVSAQSSPATATIISDTTAPNTPTNLSVTPSSSSQIYLTWDAPKDDIGVAGYYIYRNNIQITNVSGTTSTSYLDFNLSSNTYAYAVEAYDIAGNISNRSFPVNITLIQDILAPSVPANLSVVAKSPSQIYISWSPSTDNLKMAGYYVYRNDTQIADVNITSYLDSGLATGTYAYAVAARDSSGNVSNQTLPISLTLTSTTIAQASTITTSTQLSTNVTATVTNTTTTSQLTANSGDAFKTFLSFGFKNDEVKILQSFLIQKNYLKSANATGIFNRATQSAIKKFQCDNKIVCNGGPASTGWGNVGVKTRKALNALYNGKISPAETSAQSEKIKTLEAQLLNLQLLLKSLQK
ncbi:peptidoglycan-binding protein [Candidatus Wolfebacteria bacterium]|nr:peptidoglycan-binding protein [Candidatus Wolfebacteria bacterium]